MSFRKVGGINRAPTNNIVKNQFSTSENLDITGQLGQINTSILVKSCLDIQAGPNCNFPGTGGNGSTGSTGSTGFSIGEKAESKLVFLTEDSPSDFIELRINSAKSDGAASGSAVKSTGGITGSASIRFPPQKKWLVVHKQLLGV